MSATALTAIFQARTHDGAGARPIGAPVEFDVGPIVLSLHFEHIQLVRKAAREASSDALAFMVERAGLVYPVGQKDPVHHSGPFTITLDAEKLDTFLAANGIDLSLPDPASGMTALKKWAKSGNAVIRGVEHMRGIERLKPDHRRRFLLGRRIEKVFTNRTGEFAVLLSDGAEMTLEKPSSGYAMGVEKGLLVITAQTLPAGSPPVRSIYRMESYARGLDRAALVGETFWVREELETPTFLYMSRHVGPALRVSAIRRCDGAVFPLHMDADVFATLHAGAIAQTERRLSVSPSAATPAVDPEPEATAPAVSP